MRCPAGRRRDRRGLGICTAILVAVAAVVVMELWAADYTLDTYDPAKAYNGSTLFTDSYRFKVLQMNMQGDILWEYSVPTNWRRAGPGFDAELLTNGNVLIVMPRKGLMEITRAGDIVWSNLDARVSHDADRLDNGDTIYVYGDDDDPTNAVVKVVDQFGSNVWSWFATNEYNVAPFVPYTNVTREGWTHVNSVTRMANGHTLVSPRNFCKTIELDTNGLTYWSIDYTNLYPGAFPVGYDPHEPELLDNDNLLVCLQRKSPYQVVEIDRAAKTSVWEYAREGLRTARDSDRLPNGNTLIVGVLTQMENSVIFEVTEAQEIVWQLRFPDVSTSNLPGWFFKAQRVIDHDQDGYQDLLDTDDDNDGLSDDDEAVAGTDPMDSNDVFKVQEIVPWTGGSGFVISWDSVTGRTYRVYRNPDLLVAWPTGIVHQRIGSGALQAYTNTMPGPKRFFRLTVE